MIKYHCDVCGGEIEDQENCANPATRLKGEKDFGIYWGERHGQSITVGFEIMVKVGSTWNAGELCKFCLIGAINYLDTRPKEARQK